MNETLLIPPLDLLRPKRRPVGMSAVLLPFTEAGDIDWPGFRAHVARTAEFGLIPAVNMDTGFGHLLSDDEKNQVLRETRDVLGHQEFVAGAIVRDQPGAAFDFDGYRRAIEAIHAVGGLPILFQSFGLSALPNDALIDAYRQLARECSRFLAFELGTMFAPFGKIYDLETYGELLAIPQCIGAKHSSLRRQPEWDRLRLRNARRPEFMVLTGNDLAIDMIMYGSDYLLGLSTFAPDWFAQRDAYWANGDPAFYELNDRLQYLGCFAFRDPIPAYKHSAAMFLKLRGWIACDRTHAKGITRIGDDLLVLTQMAKSNLERPIIEQPASP